MMALSRLYDGLDVEGRIGHVQVHLLDKKILQLTKKIWISSYSLVE